MVSLVALRGMRKRELKLEGLLKDDFWSFFGIAEKEYHLLVFSLQYLIRFMLSSTDIWTLITGIRLCDLLFGFFSM